VLDAEHIEIGLGIDPGIVQIIEGDAHSIVADRLQPDDPDVSAPGDQGLLPGSVPLNLGRRAFDPQILGRKTTAGAVVEGDLEQLFRLP
jgi:hypothetical protein